MRISDWSSDVCSSDLALDAIKTFLGYMPGHHNELPPERPVPLGSDDAAKTVAELVPEKRTQVYDMRKVIQAVVDKDSFFEMTPRFGKPAVTALDRVGGQIGRAASRESVGQAG